MPKILLITPPFVQPNSPYPATAYLKGYLGRHGIDVGQFDLSVELLGRVFSAGFLGRVFDRYVPGSGDENTERIYTLRAVYLKAIEPVMTFLRGGDATLANLICTPDYIPQAARFETMQELDAFGEMGVQDCAKYICTLFLQDISDFIRMTVAEDFEIVRYAEKSGISVPSFKALDEKLQHPLNLVEEEMLGLLREQLDACQPDFVGFTIPFPGNLWAALRCAQYIKNEHPAIRTIAGGGYPTTELRSMSDKGIFRYFDYVVLDDGELALERIIRGGKLVNTYDSGGFHASDERVTHLERGSPDFGGLRCGNYFSLLEVINPMHRLWSDGRWNKLTLAHGCYWARCAFCDTTLDYIGCYDASAQAGTIVDWMVTVAAETGSRGFHFVDEAAPPKLLKEISLEIIRRRLTFTWWTNIRFERAFTGDLCRLMAAAGCIAVSGGLEAASDRLLAMINKGVTIETATITMRNFFYAGIMTHTYLMYGLPTQTLQESIDSLEIVRQMFRAELIGSAFWHRYAMTVHSPTGREPGLFGVKHKNKHINTFANNEIRFVEDRGYDINMVGEVLRFSLANFMAGEGLDRPAHKWFEGRAPQTTVEQTEIVNHLIKPDASRIFDENTRLVWIGAQPKRTENGIVIDTPSSHKEFNLSAGDAGFLVEIMETCDDLGRKTTLGDVRDVYSKYSGEPFSTLYHSKKWDQLRELGLLQI